MRSPASGWRLWGAAKMRAGPVFLPRRSVAPTGPRDAFLVLAATAGAGAAVGAGSAFLHRNADSDLGSLGRVMVRSAGRGAGFGLAGGLGALTYVPLSRHVESIFNKGSPLGRAAGAMARASTQAALAGAGVGLFRALLPPNERWHQQPLGQRLRAFVTPEVRSWAGVGASLGLGTHLLAQLSSP
jgi:hypothetical protein